VVIESRGGARLASKSLQHLRILHQIFSEKLESDGAAERQILGLVNDSHAATTEFLDYPVMRNDVASGEGRLTVCFDQRLRKEAAQLFILAQKVFHHLSKLRCPAAYLVKKCGSALRPLTKSLSKHSFGGSLVISHDSHPVS
jgi:hypothetical protein